MPALTYAYIGIYCSPWPEQPPPRTRSTPSPSPGGARSWTCSPAGSVPSTTWSSELGLAQPQVSKHLRVLREVGAVDVRDEGRRRLYRINGEALKPIHDWVVGFEQLWTERFDRLDDVLEDLKREEQGDVAGDE